MWVAESRGRKAHSAELGIKSWELKTIATKETCQRISGQQFECKLGNKTKDVNKGC